MLSAGAEAGAGGSHHMSVFQQIVKEFPARHLIRSSQPHIGGIDAAVNLVTGLLQAVQDIGGVFHVFSHHFADLSLSLGRVDGLSGPLHDVGCAVVLGSVSSGPERIEGRAVLILQSLRHHRIGQAQSGEAGVLGEGTQLDGAGFSSFAFIDAVRNVLLRNIGFIGRVKNDHTAFSVGIIHPFLQLRFRQSLAGGVVWEAQVDQIRALLRKIRNEAIFRRTGHVDHIAPGLCGRIVCAGPARHHVGIHIYRIDGITDRDPAVRRKNLLNVGGIRFGAVGNENLIRGDLAASGLKIVLRDRLS